MTRPNPLSGGNLRFRITGEFNKERRKNNPALTLEFSSNSKQQPRTKRLSIVPRSMSVWAYGIYRVVFEQKRIQNVYGCSIMLWTVIGVPDTFYANDPLDFTSSAFFFLHSTNLRSTRIECKNLRWIIENFATRGDGFIFDTFWVITRKLCEKKNCQKWICLAITLHRMAYKLDSDIDRKQKIYYRFF